MNKNTRLFILILILAIIAFFMYKLAFSKPTPSKKEDFSGIQSYIKDIYGTTFLIPEFENINEANEDWLWENVNQYVWNHDDEYHEQNAQEYGYTYEEVSKIVKSLYGDTLTKKFPKGAVSMRYNYYQDLYGPTAFSIVNYYDYKIEKITKEGNLYTVSLYDFTVSLNKFTGDDETDDYFEIFNNYDYLLNAENGTPIVKVKSLKDKDFQNILDQKEKLSHKILTIKYDEENRLYYIQSCQYKDKKDTDLLATMYHEMQETFEIMSIDYNQEDIYTQDEIQVNNFEDLTKIYTENAKNIYKEEMNLFVYKENGEVYITAGDITVRDFLAKIEFENIEASTDKITCNVKRTFRKSFDPSSEDYNETYQKENTFTIVKQNETWLIEDFSYNK
ncbi:MAG: hypothetical protein IJ867_06695 [Clostridia bacterium]|nr:hypothetical protein [Clostridia bacterium]